MAVQERPEGLIQAQSRTVAAESTPIHHVLMHLWQIIKHTKGRED